MPGRDVPIARKREAIPSGRPSGRPARDSVVAQQPLGPVEETVFLRNDAA